MSADTVSGQMGRPLVVAAGPIFATNDRMNQMLIEALEPEAWRATPPGGGRTIAAIFTHLHNVRAKWVRLTAPHVGVPVRLSRARCTPEEARAGLAESAARCEAMLEEAFAGRVTVFRRDGWGASWPVGPEMLCYMLAHEAHHRGQVCMLARQVGFALPVGVGAGIWDWALAGTDRPGVRRLSAPRATADSLRSG